MKAQKKTVKWIKEHKKLLLATGISVGALILMIVGIKNKEKLQTLFDSLRRVEETSCLPNPEAVVAAETVLSAQPVQQVKQAENIIPFPVRGYPRRLPEGQHASTAKIAEAISEGIELKPDQTWVTKHERMGKKVVA